MRVIDADELIEHVWRDRLDSRERIANLVESMPTIKTIPATGIAPIVHGRWENYSPITIKCSRCGHVIHDWRYSECKYYCPNCGAKMDGERKENCNEAD